MIKHPTDEQMWRAVYTTAYTYNKLDVGGFTSATVGRRWGVHTRTVTAPLHRFDAAGLVEEIGLSQGKRQARWQLTAAGWQHPVGAERTIA